MRVSLTMLSLLIGLMMGQAAPPQPPADAPADTAAAPGVTPSPPSAALLDPHPLTASQAARLETADDKSGTIDEAALYALLENVENWSDKEAGAVVPDYDDIRRHPDRWRGQRVLIEGRVKRVISDLNLTTSGWERVQGVVLLINPALALNDPNAKAHDFAIIYMTDPPAWKWWRKDQGLPLEHGQHVRMTARFFKLTLQETQRAAQNNAKEKLSYVTFVGKQFTSMVKPGATDDGSSSRSGKIILTAILVMAAVGYFFYRLHTMRRNYANRPSLRDRIEERRSKRDERDHEDDTGPEIPLPRDPIGALDVLSQAHEDADAVIGSTDTVTRRLDGDDLADDHPTRRNGEDNGDGQAPAYLSDKDNGDSDDHDEDSDDQSKPADPAKD
ncbi:MAG: hypothetical protein GC159_14085 [Phycisphaera sp.]|nr:hypothetical protein [Phycisphaera sp.]